MIDYEVLCQTIEDWRAGRRPSLDLSATPAAAVEGYAEADQGYADDGGYEQQPYAEPGYEQQPYAEQGYEGQYAEPGYEQPQYAEGQYAEQGHEDGQYAEPGYEQPQYAEQGYEQVPEGGYEGYDEQGAPDPVPAGSTSPVDVEDLAYSEDDDDPHYG